ncbi:MAG: hypothetical protein EOP48_19475 [Sphingobacteriales bacterium]|nr:MAG: hypothetical protein EOP48_19475 [Sphingobacteriales bacterium]
MKFCKLAVLLPFALVASSTLAASVSFKASLSDDQKTIVVSTTTPIMNAVVCPRISVTYKLFSKSEARSLGTGSLVLTDVELESKTSDFQRILYPSLSRIRSSFPDAEILNTGFKVEHDCLPSTKRSPRPDMTYCYEGMCQPSNLDQEAAYTFDKNDFYVWSDVTMNVMSMQEARPAYEIETTGIQIANKARSHVKNIEIYVNGELAGEEEEIAENVFTVRDAFFVRSALAKAVVTMNDGNTYEIVEGDTENFKFVEFPAHIDANKKSVTIKTLNTIMMYFNPDAYLRYRMRWEFFLNLATMFPYGFKNK